MPEMVCNETDAFFQRVRVRLMGLEAQTRQIDFGLRPRVAPTNRPYLPRQEAVLDTQDLSRGSEEGHDSCSHHKKEVIVGRANIEENHSSLPRKQQRWSWPLLLSLGYRVLLSSTPIAR